MKIRAAHRLLVGSNTRFSVPMLSGSDYDLGCDLLALMQHPDIWEPVYRAEVPGILANSVRRAKEEIRRDHSSIRNSKLDVELTLCRIKPDRVHLRGDYRYPSEKITEYLRKHPKRETPPIQIGCTQQGMHLLDGHHRWRGYLEADRDPLVILITTVPRQTDEPMVNFVVKV